MTEQFNIRSTKAKLLATEIAARKNMTLAQVVELALEHLKQQEATTQVDEQAVKDAAWARLVQAGDENRAYLIATGGKLSSDHSELYDDNGLPI
jgi:hypothetical protein